MLQYELVLRNMCNFASRRCMCHMVLLVNPMSRLELEKIAFAGARPLLTGYIALWLERRAISA